ncbi:MAG: hypothetical protein H6626_00515 [Pseudobdellovibrionaceae bacterium]|nr:hypothetical protein [Bdellovibrionales bacterium]USN47606.1 MAG: hypothetical protein H6626_00515 [Pseudobdellovibrionaceae bacterium]
MRDTDTLTSRGGSDTTTGTVRVDGGLLAECNAFSDQVTELNGQISTYYDPLTGQYAPTIIRLHLESYPEAIVNSDNYYVQFFRWAEDIPGNRVTNSRPVSFYFVQEGSGMTISAQTPVNKISKATINNLIQEFSLNISGTTTDNFLDRFLIIMTDMSMQYDAVKMAVYDDSQGSSAIAYYDVLLPPFSANPANYNALHKATALQALHPLQHLINSGATDVEFYNYSKEMCAGFFQKLDTRNPASIKPVSGLWTRIWTWIKNTLSVIF